MAEQLNLFFEGSAACTPRKKIQAFYDYDAYVAKFRDLPKTTDDTYTPEDVYRVLLSWLDPYIVGRRVVRPFFPGGDYEATDYPDGCVVVDNPPFSRQIEIVRWYAARQIPFFLFCHGMTAFDLIPHATVVVIGGDMRFANGAMICVNFASNLFGDVACMTAPELRRLFDACDSQAKDRMVRTKTSWPENMLAINELSKLSRGGVELSIPRGDYRIFRTQSDIDPFGTRLLVRTETARRITEELARVEDASTKKVRLDSYNLRQLAELEAEHEHHA